MKKIKGIYVLGLLAACIAMLAAPRQGSTGQAVADEPEDTVIYGRVNEYSDSVLQEIQRQREEMLKPDYMRRLYGLDSLNVPEDDPYKIHLITRCYDDRIVLRWAPSEYVPFRYLRDAGYTVMRFWGSKDEGYHNDTLAVVKPWTVDRFKQKFEQNDSVAGMAVELLYGQLTTLDQTEAAPGSMKSIVEVYEQQQDVVGSAMYIAEVRPDLAEAMGLMFTDRNVRKGIDYIYSVAPNLPDSVLHVVWGTSDVIRIGGETLNLTRLECPMLDSVAAPTQAFVYWPRLPYSSYDIERREVTNGMQGEWKKLNDKPYISFISDHMDEDADNFFQDNTEHEGVFEYRLYAYDSFGDRIGPSEAHTLIMPDMVAPVPPDIDQFLVTYVTDDSIRATIFFHKDSLEADLLGYVPMYRGDLRDSTAKWQQLTDHMLVPGTTQCTVPVSGLSAGHVCIAAYDKAGNHSLSMEQLLNIEDYTPPSPPTNLRANVAPDGFTVLRWTASPEPDVSYYEVYYANEPDDLFMNMANPDQRDTVFVDSLAQGLNQAYIYYKVKAIDYSGNSSDFSSMLRVARPNYIPPQVCRIDSVWMTDTDINMWWMQSNENDLAFHRLFRKLDNATQWELVGVYNADSVRMRGNRIRVKDAPKVNMRDRYVYAMETQNLSGVTSGFSQVQTFHFKGPRIIDIKLRLSAFYNADKHETRLAWETGRVPDYGSDWYYCVFRKGPDDREFQFMLSSSNDDPAYNDFLLRPGQKAEYYVTVQYEDGRRSKPSNIVTVSGGEAKDVE